MDIRPAESADRERISATTRDSLQSSCSLGPPQIETVLAQEFDATSRDDPLNDPGTTALVAAETNDGTETETGP